MIGKTFQYGSLYTSDIKKTQENLEKIGEYVEIINENILKVIDRFGVKYIAFYPTYAESFDGEENIEDVKKYVEEELERQAYAKKMDQKIAEIKKGTFIGKVSPNHSYTYFVYHEYYQVGDKIYDISSGEGVRRHIRVFTIDEFKKMM